MTTPDLNFVRAVVGTIRTAGLDTWIFGGWAEELRGLRPPSIHADLDLLLRATSFVTLEALVATLPGVHEIREKRFSHKRAFVWIGVRVDIFLAQPGAPDTTTMFDRRVVVRWPADTFTEDPGDELPIASKAALLLYRLDHRSVERAYNEFVGS